MRGPTPGPRHDTSQTIELAHLLIGRMRAVRAGDLPCRTRLLRLARKERERLGHEVGMELEHRAVSGIGIDDEFVVRKALRQVARVLAGPCDHCRRSRRGRGGEPLTDPRASSCPIGDRGFRSVLSSPSSSRGVICLLHQRSFAAQCVARLLVQDEPPDATHRDRSTRSRATGGLEHGARVLAPPELRAAIGSTRYRQPATRSAGPPA